MKHAAMVAVALWLAVMLWAGGLVLRTDPSARLSVPPTPAGDNAALQLDTARARQALAAIEPLRRAQANAVLAPAALLATAPAGLAASAAPTAAPGTGDGEAPAQAPARSVSLVYYARDFRRAIIDGVYVRPGSRLADGTRVVDIGVDAVVLRDARGRHRIKVARDSAMSVPPPHPGKVTR